jgi:hypothetical protein
MRVPVLLISFIVFFCCEAKSQETRIIDFKVTAVNFGITTPARTSCSEFENTFSNTQYKTTEIVDTSQTIALEKLIKRVKFAKTFSGDIDVRAKVFLNYGKDDKERILCIDRFYHIIYDGKMLSKNKRLVNFLKNYLKEFE